MSGAVPAERRIRISAPQGLHLRVAALVVAAVRAMRAQLTVAADGQQPARGDSVIDLLRLGATCGTSVTVRAEGPDAERAVRRVEELFSDGGGI